MTNEIDRQVKRLVVFDAQSREHWVAIERVQSIRLRGPGKTILKINLDQPKKP